MNTDEYIQSLKSEYSSEIYFSNIENNFKIWRENVESKDDRKILEQIFMNLEFYSKIKIKKLLEQKINELKIDYDGLKQAVICPMVPPEGRQSGANELTSLIKEIIQEKIIRKEGDFLPYKQTMIQDLIYLDESSSHIIIVDDIIGTGGTFSKYLEANKGYFEDKTLILLCILITEKGREKIEELKEKYESVTFDIRYHSQPSKLSKLNVLSDKQYERLKEIESNLWKHNTNYILGFKGSELLILFSHNIPNNSLSSFWFCRKGNPWESLFPRISAQNKQRQNYHNAKRNGNAK